MDARFEAVKRVFKEATNQLRLKMAEADFEGVETLRKRREALEIAYQAEAKRYWAKRLGIEVTP